MKPEIRVLGVVGSPRPAGNTDIMVDEILKGAEEAGAIVQKVHLNEMNITPCQACYHCRDKGSFKNKDDMVRMVELMDETDIWVLGTPLYFWGPSAQFKAFVDRWAGSRMFMDFKGKDAVLAIPMGSGNESDARHCIGMMTDSLEYMGMDLVETVLAPGAYEAGEVRKFPKVLKKARDAGFNVVKNRLQK